MDEILSQWQTHRDASWPKMSNSNEGQLMTLDTVISGCVAYFLDCPDKGLDAQRLDILRSCLADLNSLLPEIEEEASHYFERLHRLAGLLLEVSQG